MREREREREKERERVGGRNRLELKTGGDIERMYEKERVSE